jgi:hypothetical protein
VSEIPHDAAQRCNYQLFPGFAWRAVWGGAALVRRLLVHAIAARDNSVKDPDVSGKYIVDVPRDTRGLKGWSILLSRIAEMQSTASGEETSELALAKRIVEEGIDKPLKNVPIAQFGKLILVDHREIEGYRSIENLLREYIDSRKGGKPKPLSIGIFGPPGSGKSFGIKEIAKEIRNPEIKPFTYNLTQLDKPRDLVNAFHAARDEALKGNLPMLIFDEFDCAFAGEPWGWLKSFLAPMQDGEFTDDGGIHPLGHAIFVFTGGIAHSFTEFGNPTSDRERFVSAKGPDFVSRLKGFVDVQGINPAPIEDAGTYYAAKSQVDPVCMVRRAMLLRSLLEEQKHRTRHMNPVKDGVSYLEIDPAVLSALLMTARYRHGARSLESVLLMSRLTDRDHFGLASLPSNAQLEIHVDEGFSDLLKTALQ